MLCGYLRQPSLVKLTFHRKLAKVEFSIGIAFRFIGIAFRFIGIAFRFIGIAFRFIGIAFRPTPGNPRYVRVSGRLDAFYSFSTFYLPAPPHVTLWKTRAPNTPGLQEPKPCVRPRPHPPQASGGDPCRGYPTGWPTAFPPANASHVYQRLRRR